MEFEVTFQRVGGENVLHDDETKAVATPGSGPAGYGDNLDCGVRIRANKGGLVNFHLVQMNLEGDGNGI